MALRQLLWLINAHPKLIAHAQIFMHLGALLESAQSIAGVFREPALVETLPQWIALCRWIRGQRKVLAQQPGLASFDRQPKHARDHPLVGEGVSRHGLVAAMWNQHHSATVIPPDAHTPIAQRYFHLQMQTLAAFIEARFRYNRSRAGAGYSGLEHYEQFTGAREWPIAPSQTAAVGLAIRELSLAEHDALVALLPEVQSAEDYAQAMAALEIAAGDDSDPHAQRIGHYVSSLNRYFSRYASLLSRGDAYRPYRRTRAKRYGSGGRQHRPGYINLPEIPGVFLQTRRTLAFEDGFDDDWLGEGDEEATPLEATTVFINAALEEADEETKTLEAAGLSPAESLEPALQLFPAGQLGTKLAELRRQQLAIEMQAQPLPFFYATPTPLELNTLHAFLLRRIQRHLAGKAQNRSQARIECIGALILLTMLALGQPLSRVRELHFAVHDPAQTLALSTGHTTLILNPGAGVGAALGHPAELTRGFWIPAIGPTYKSDLPQALADMQQPPLAQGFLLPDTLGVGQWLTRFLNTETRPNNRVFGIEPVTARQTIRTLLKTAQLERLTHARIARVMPTAIRSLGADATAAWLLCAQSDCGDEPRMFYTQHRIDSLVALYRRASRRLKRRIGIQAASQARDADEPCEQMSPVAVVGARFVAPLTVVSALIETLVAEIRTSRRTPLSGEPLVAYHSSYTLYTWLFQALSTSIRALTSPRANALFLVPPDEKVCRYDASLSDKDDERCSRARLALVDDTLALQLQYYRAHTDNLLQRLQPQLNRRDAQDWYPFVVVDERRRFIPLTPGWVTEQMAARGAPLPANFQRGFLRTELLARGVAGEVIDAFLGHFNDGEAPFARFSSFDHGLHRRQLEPAIAAVHEALGLVPLKSRLLHYLDRGCGS